MTVTETIIGALRGKRVRIPTRLVRDIELTITDVKAIPHVRDLEPSSPANDWWPLQETWYSYLVYFDNGEVRSYSNLDEITLA